MTDALESSFDAAVQGERIAALEADLGALRVAMQRPALDGVKGGAPGSFGDPARSAFVDRYVRQGLEAGVELKSFSGATGAAGGYAVPREIDQLIGTTLKSLSPIRAIANVVRTGTAGPRRCSAIRWSRRRICPTSRPTACRSPLAISRRAMSWPSATRRASCAIRSATSRSCISMRSGGSAGVWRIARRSN